MYRSYRIVAFTPSGRKRTQSILLDNLSRFTDIIDEYQVWINTDESQKEDLKWLRSLPDIYDWVKVIELPKETERLSPKQMNTGYFYVNTTEENTIYVRFDDDIIYVDDSFFVNLLDFRIDNPGYFLVMANILNNSIISYIYQRLGIIPEQPYKVEEPFCMDPIGWRSGKFAELLHQTLFDKIRSSTVADFFFDRADLTNVDRFSISCFCFFGRDFKKFNGVVGQRRPGIIRHDEEVWLTEVYPILNNRLNTICGSALVAHYSFFAQRPYLDTLDILERYRQIGKSKLSESYYDLLDENKIRASLDKTKLKTVKLPRADYASSYADAFKAERAGYKVIFQGDNKAEIVYKGQVCRTLVAAHGQKISERSIDDALALTWRNATPQYSEPETHQEQLQQVQHP